MNTTIDQNINKPWVQALGLFSLILATLALNRSGVDQAITSLFYDPASQSFPLKNVWLMSSVLHSGIRNLSALLWLALAACLIGLSIKKWRGKPMSARSGIALETLRWLVPVLLLAAAFTAGLKSQSAHSCPWDLRAYGGNADFVYLLDSAQGGQNSGPGKCFPSGHASSGWMWIALLFVPSYLRRKGIETATNIKLALWGAVMALGFITSAVQVARGAHFVSHTTATAALCWAVALLGSLIASRFRL